MKIASDLATLLYYSAGQWVQDTTLLFAKAIGLEHSFSENKSESLEHSFSESDIRQWVWDKAFENIGQFT